MKKIIATITFIASFMSVNAQGQWERPTDDEQTKPRKALFDTAKKDVDPKYLVGAVTEQDGKVCWIKNLELKGMSADAIYDKILATMQDFVKGPKQLERSRVAVVNKEMHQIGVKLQEDMIFADKVLSLDKTIFNYHLLINCKDGGCEIKMTNLSYLYEPDRPNGGVIVAEDMITDKEALNKKKTGFTKGGAKKFRTKTIDRKDEVFALLEQAFK